jgi:hypothetical protein
MLCKFNVGASGAAGALVAVLFLYQTLIEINGKLCPIRPSRPRFDFGASS